MIDIAGMVAPLAGERLRPLGHPSVRAKAPETKGFYSHTPNLATREMTRENGNTPRTDPDLRVMARVVCSGAVHA